MQQAYANSQPHQLPPTRPASAFRDMVARRRDESRMLGSLGSSKSDSASASHSATPRQPSSSKITTEHTHRTGDQSIDVRRSLGSLVTSLSNPPQTTETRFIATTANAATSITAHHIPRTLQHEEQGNVAAINKPISASMRKAGRSLPLLGPSPDPETFARHAMPAGEFDNPQKNMHTAHMAAAAAAQPAAAASAATESNLPMYVVIPPSRRRPSASAGTHRRKSIKDIAPTNSLTDLKISGDSGSVRPPAIVSTRPQSRPGSSIRKMPMNTSPSAMKPNRIGQFSKSSNMLIRDNSSGSNTHSERGAETIPGNEEHARHTLNVRRAPKPPPDLPRWNPSTRYMSPGPEDNSTVPYDQRSNAADAANHHNNHVSLKSLRAAGFKSEPMLMKASNSERSLTNVALNISTAKPSAAPYADFQSPTTAQTARFESLPNEQPEGSYRATPLQWDIYTRACPSKDEKESPGFDPYVGPSFNITQVYRITNHAVNTVDFCKVVNKICSLYSVARTRFYRNERILDADVEGMVDQRPWEELPLDMFVNVKDATGHEKLMSDQNTDVIEYAHEWAEELVGIGMPFCVLAATLPKSPGTDLRYTVLVFAASLAIMDEVSLTWLARECIVLYRECYRLRKFGQSEDDVFLRISRHMSIESEQFCEFANECQRTKTDMAFWHDQCIEVRQDSVETDERVDLEGKLKRLGKEKTNLAVSMTSLAKRKSDLEVELKELRHQRRQIDKGENGEGVISEYVDAATGETIHITREARAALIKAVLGEDAASDNVMSLLDKHEVPKEAQRKINAPTLTLEEFAAITEPAVEDLGLMSRDRRKIVALAEYVRNRIKDCLHEQSKLKFALERKIAKAARDLEACTDTLKSTRSNLESNDDLSIRLNYILRPPYVETKIQALSLSQQYDTPDIDKISSTTSLQAASATSKWGFVSLQINEETIENLRRFRANWAIAAKTRQKTRHTDPNVSSDNESLLDSEDENEDSVYNDDTADACDGATIGRSPYVSTASLGDDAAPDAPHDRRMKTKSVDVMCLAAYAVLLKHITGVNKYLVGITQSYRRKGLYTGPLTDTMPIRVDLTKKGLTFDSLFAALFKVFRNGRCHGVACTQNQVAAAFGMPGNLDARFEFIHFRDTREWQRCGILPSDLLQNPGPCFKADGILTERLWTINNQDQYDIKLVLVETMTGIEGGIRFLKSRFDEEKISKWMSKYQSILESIDCGPKKIPVSSLISRFYHTVWQGSASNLGSTMSLYSSLSSSINKLNN